ncbi:MAG: TonB-dependent receptor [Burkholderiaceae bacterium]
MNNTYPSTGVSARARHQRHGSQMPAHSSNFSVQLSLVLALSAYSVHAWAQESAPDVVTSAARTSQVVTDALNSTTLISRADIDSATVSDVASLLRQQVGISIRQNGTQGSVTGVSIRGGEVRHTLVLVDGVPLNTLNFGAAAIEQVPLSLIDRIEVVRGNVSALYGSQATGGLIQIFTRKTKSGTDADIHLAMGDKGQKQTSIQMSTGNDKVQLTAGIAHEQVKAVSAKADINANIDKDGYRNNSGNISVRFTPNSKNEFGIRAYETHGRVDYDQLVYKNVSPYDVDFDKSISSIHYAKTKLQQISGYSNNQITDHWSSQFKISQLTDHRNEFGIVQGQKPSESWIETQTQNISWQNQIDLGLGALIAGVGYERQKPKSDAGLAFKGNKRINKSAWLGYNLDQGRHHLQLNSRFDKVSNIGGFATGAINYGFDVTQAIRVFAGYSNGFTAPHFNSLYSKWGSNPSLKPETATYFQTGAQYVVQNYGARMTYFNTLYRDKIGYTTQYVNIDRAKSEGVELHGWFNQSGWNVDAGITYQEVTDRKTGDWLLVQPRILANLGIGKSWDQWQAQVDWLAQGKSKAYGGIVNPGFGVLNASLFYQPRKDLKLGLTVGNVFDRKYEPVAGYNAMPRHFLFSVNYKPQW